MKTKSNKSNAGLPNRPEQPRSNQAELPAPSPTLPASQSPAWTGVFFDGPAPEQDREGEEIPVWHVFVGTEDAEPTGTVYRVFSFAKAQSLAQAISNDRRLDLVAEASPA